MSKKNWSKLFNKKNRTHKDSYNFNNKNLDDIVDFGTKAYKYDGKRWKESKEEDEQELEMSDSYTVNNPDSFASSKALFDLNAKVASDLTGLYTKSETDAKIVSLSAPIGGSSGSWQGANMRLEAGNEFNSVNNGSIHIGYRNTANTVIYSNTTAGNGQNKTITFDAGRATFHRAAKWDGLDFSINTDNSTGGTANYFRGTSSHLVIGTGGTLYLNIGNEAGSTYIYGNLMQNAVNKIWHAGNDGSGSGLDADLLDGKQATEFLHTSAGQTGFDGSTRISDTGNFNTSLPSGFYQSSSASNMPPGGSWHNMINVRHSNPGNDHGFQLAMSYYNNDLWFRSYQGGTGNNDGAYQTWAKAATEAYVDDNAGGGLIRAATAPAGAHNDGTEWLDTNDNKLYKYLSITAADTAAGVTDTWRPISSANGSVLVGQPEYKYRHIYAHSYTGMGYKSGTPWKNVNRTDHINDTTTNLGDRFDRSQGYCDAGWDDTSEIIYAHGIGNVQGGSHNYTSTYNMRTDTGLGGSANMSIARADAGVSVDMTRRFGYIGGGGSASFTKMSYTTNVGVHSGDIAGPSSGGSSTAHFGEHYGWHNNNGTALKFDFATTTATAWARTYGVAGCQKAMSSKNGVGLAGRNGSCGTSDGWDEYNDSTGSYNWHGTKPYTSIGEENYSMGQDRGYCIGAFDGAVQGNFSFVWNYASRSGNSLGAAGQPKGHDGMSSGFGCSRKG